MNFPRRFALLAVFAVSISLTACTPTRVYKGTAPVSSWNFDWDDNIAFMPTKIEIFSTANEANLEVTTGEFAEIRGLLGKPGKYENYKTDPDNTTGSFRFFRDAPGRNYFLEDLNLALQSPESTWQGPSFSAFTKALSKPELAARTTVITARGHSPESMMAGISRLQEQGYVKHLPTLEHLYAVSHPSFGGLASNPSETKAVVMKKLLDELETVPVARTARAVLDRDGEKKAQMHLWGFSDDDWGNFSTAVKVLSNEVQNGKWGHIKITVFYTGTRTPEIPPHNVIIKSDGTTRDQTAKEVAEIELL